MAWTAATTCEPRLSCGFPGSPSQRVHIYLTARLYLIFGHRPMAAKAMMALLGAAAAALMGLMLAPIFGRTPALLSALLAALWPSAIFFTSQNFKDALVMLLCYGAISAGLKNLRGASTWPSVLGGLGALLIVGLFRPYIMIVTTFAIGAGHLFAWAKAEGPRPPAAAGLVIAAAMPLVFYAFAGWIFTGPLKTSLVNLADPTGHLRIIPATYSPITGKYVFPFTPRNIAEMRRIRQESDLYWAQQNKNRRIGTQLFYGLQLDGWLDLLAFLPKGIFYVLFMPLPGFYPLEHNLGRILASVENVGLLIIACAAAFGILRIKKGGSQMLLLTFLAAMSVGSALLEFDLGSATRHRLLYMPFLFPFALSMLETPVGADRRGRKLKVFEVLECGGPGGTGNQVAALCNGLDPAKFEVGLVFAARGSDPEAYRRLAAGAKSAFHVPEMMREISPIKDLRAFLKLYKIFKAERPDVVHAHSSKAGILARLAARAAGVPRVFYSPHGYGFLQQDRSAFSRAVYRAAESAASLIGETIAVSPSEGGLARGLSWGAPVHVVCDSYLGEMPEGAHRGEPGKILVGGCGRLTAARNPDAFATLCQRTTDSRNGLRCLWIGGGELEAALRQNLENMNLLSKVEITGWVPQQQALARLRGLDIFVHFSRWDGLSNAILEAMAQGLPVVASDIPGNRDAVIHGETGFLAQNEVELLEYCLKLVDDPDLRRRLGQAGRERVRREFSRKGALERMEAIYLAPIGRSDIID